MAPLKIRRFDCASPKAAAQLRALRDQFGNEGEVVSAKDRKRTQAVFGEALSPIRAVERICHDVRDKGMDALLYYTEQFDKSKLTPETVRVSEEDLEAAYRAANPEFLDTIRRIRENITQFQSGILHSSAELRVLEHHELQLRYRPMQRVGFCVPGGAAAYPSSLMMTVCPAQVAGVKELAVVMPPTPFGADNPDMRAVCHLLGIHEVYRIGGAQAVAALAYGVEGIAPVDMIVGPGNLFVALAKKHVYGKVAIDCIAGPSEVVVVADNTALPHFVAMDLIAQAEHSPGVSILVCWDEGMFDQVQTALEKQLAELTRGDLARDCLEKFGAFILARDEEEAIQVVNLLAPEHLHIQTRDPEGFADQIDHAGAMFLGAFTPVALGDYAAGPSHVLPTGGTGKFASGLCANDFLKRTSLLLYTRNGLRDLADDAIALAEKEGLTAHAASIDMRLRDLPRAARPNRKPEKPEPLEATPAKQPVASDKPKKPSTAKRQSSKRD